MIKIKIDLMKIDKSLIFNAESGAKYCDIIAIETPNSPHNDYMLVQDLSKERREAGEKGPIIGNASRLMPRNQPNDQQAPGDGSASDNAPGPGDDGGDLPF